MDAKQRAYALDRALRLFTDVRSGEGANALLLSLNIFLILTALYILKPVREALILGEGSAELKSYVAAGQVLILAILVPWYGRLAARYPRRRLINVVTTFFVGCLGLFYFLSQLDVSLGVVFFLWLGVVSLMIPSLFWSFANDVYTKDEGERLFPLVQFGGALGAVVGAGLAGTLVAPLGVYPLMLIAAACLVGQLLVANILDARERKRTEGSLPEVQTTAVMPAATAQVRKETGELRVISEGEHQQESRGAFHLVLKTRYLLLIALLMLIANWVKSNGDYVLGSVVSNAAAEAIAAGEAGHLSVEQVIGQFYSKFYGIVNVVALVTQLFLVSRIIKYFGVPLGILALPITSMGVYGLLAFFPVLSLARWAKTIENATNHSLNVTSYNMLFLPCTREQKYAAKQAIDSFFVRMGDVGSALLVFVGTTTFALGASGFAKFNLCLVSAWLVLAVMVGREYKRLVKTGQPPS